MGAMVRCLRNQIPDQRTHTAIIHTQWQIFSLGEGFVQTELSVAQHDQDKRLEWFKRHTSFHPQTPITIDGSAEALGGCGC